MTANNMPNWFVYVMKSRYLHSLIEEV
jgi:hypothetical protein